MSDQSGEDKMDTIRSALDLDIVRDNILDIAEFTVEKHEFKSDSTLSSDMREKAVARIREALLKSWEEAEETRRRMRRKILAEAFSTAEKTLHEVLEESS